MSGRTFEDGRRNGVRTCISWLHAHARSMNDPHARAILNAAAFALGVSFKHGLPPTDSPRTETGPELGPGRSSLLQEGGE